MLKLIVNHSPALIGFLLSLKLNLSKPQFEHVVRLSDALITTDRRHKTKEIGSPGIDKTQSFTNGTQSRIVARDSASCWRLCGFV